jgi:hypothetical protein
VIPEAKTPRKTISLKSIALMVVSDYLACPLAIHSTDFGIIEDVEIVKTDPSSDVVSRHLSIQIRDFADLEKIKMPIVTHNEAATHFRYQAMCEVYDGILPVKKVGRSSRCRTSSTPRRRSMTCCRWTTRR